MELQAEGPGKTSYTVSKSEFLVSPVSARSCNTTSLFRILNPNPPPPKPRPFAKDYIRPFCLAPQEISAAKKRTKQVERLLGNSYTIEVRMVGNTT